MIGRIYLLKSSEAERCILPDDAHRKPPARADCAKTAPKSNSAQSEHLAGQQEYHAYISVLLRKGAFKVFRFQSAPRRRPLAFAHAQNALFHLPVSNSGLYAPKASSCSPEPKATLCVGLYPNRPLEPACAQSPSCPPESKAALRGCLNPRLPFTSTRIQSPSCHPGSKDPPRVRPSLKHPSCSPKS